jgi:hypothetical protein
MTRSRHSARHDGSGELATSRLQCGAIHEFTDVEHLAALFCQLVKES